MDKNKQNSLQKERKISKLSNIFISNYQPNLLFKIIFLEDKAKPNLLDDSEYQKKIMFCE